MTPHSSSSSDPHPARSTNGRPASTNEPTETDLIVTRIQRLERTKSIIIGALLALIVGSLTAWMLMLATAEPAAVQTDWTTLPACPTDETDQPDCYWDAQLRGNGEGQSFAIIDGQLVTR